MANEKVLHLYNEIREITQQIGKFKLPEYFMERIKTALDPSWLDEDGDINSEESDEQLTALLNSELKNKAPELYEKMHAFFDEYVEDDPDNPGYIYCETIFHCSSQDDPDLIDLVKYDPNEVDPINLCFLMVFSDAAIEDYNLFINYEEFYPYVRERNPELADFKEGGYPFISYFNLAQFICKVNRGTFRKVLHLYDEIREITQQIGKFELPEYFMERIKTALDPSWLDKDGNIVSEEADEQLTALLDGELKSKAPELYEKMQAFFNEYVEEIPDDPEYPGYCETIFDRSPLYDPDRIKYDPNEVDPINLCFLMIFGNSAFDHNDLFMDYRDFYPYVRERNPELADFMEEGYPFNSYFSLAQFVCNVNR